MKKSSLLSIIVFISVIGFAQSPILNWTRTYHGNENSVDSSSVMKIYEIDKSIYTGVTTDAFGTANDFLLIKRDFLTGDTLWTRRYNGPFNGDDQFTDMVINQNTGEIYITGKSLGNGTGYDIVLIKYSKDGNVLWSKRWNNLYSNKDDFPSSIDLDKDGNVYVSGSTYNEKDINGIASSAKSYNVVFLKYNSTGILFEGVDVLTRQLGCTFFKNLARYSDGSISRYADDYVLKIDVGSNGEIFYSGETTIENITYGYFDCLEVYTLEYYLSALSSSNKTIGNNGWSFYSIKLIGNSIDAMEIDNSNYIYIATTSTVTSQNKKYNSIRKMDNRGDNFYHLDYLVSDQSKNVFATKIKHDQTGNLYIVGCEENNQNNLEWFVVKLDVNGIQEWKINKNNTINGDNFPKDIAFDNMQNPIIAGTTINSEGHDELTIVKLNKNTGSEIYSSSYKKEGSSTVPYNIHVDNKNNTIINGVEKSEYISSVLIVKYSSPIADAGAITGELNVCQGENNVTYQVPEIENASSYLWTIPRGATGNSTTNSITLSFSPDASSDEISVRGINSFGEGKSSSLPVTILPQPQIFAGNDTTICAGSGIILSAKGGHSYNWNNEVVQNVEFTPSITNNYIVIGSNGLCQNSDEITVTVNTLPAPPSIYMTDGVLYSTISGENAWYFNNSIIPDANSNSYTPINSGEYFAVISDGTCTSLPSNVFNHINTAAEYYNIHPKIKVYPNPSNGIFRVELNNSEGLKKINIFDSTGKLVKNARTHYSTFEINLTNNSKGIYLLKVFYNGITYEAKIELK